MRAQPFSIDAITLPNPRRKNDGLVNCWLSWAEVHFCHLGSCKLYFFYILWFFRWSSLLVSGWLIEIKGVQRQRIMLLNFIISLSQIRRLASGFVRLRDYIEITRYYWVLVAEIYFCIAFRTTWILNSLSILLRQEISDLISVSTVVLYVHLKLILGFALDGWSQFRSKILSIWTWCAGTVCNRIYFCGYR